MAVCPCSIVRFGSRALISDFDFSISFSWSFFCALLFGFGLSPFTKKPAQSGRPAGVVFRGHRARPPVERTGEGDRAKQAEGSAAEKDLKTAGIFQTISASAGATGGTHGPRMRRDRCASSCLSPIIPEVECSEMEARVSGAVRWRRCNGAEWKRQELAESGIFPGVSLRLCQRRHSLARARSRSSKGRSLTPQQ